MFKENACSIAYYGKQNISWSVCILSELFFFKTADLTQSLGRIQCCIKVSSSPFTWTLTLSWGLQEVLRLFPLHNHYIIVFVTNPKGGIQEINSHTSQTPNDLKRWLTVVMDFVRSHWFWNAVHPPTYCVGGAKVSSGWIIGKD